MTSPDGTVAATVSIADDGRLQIEVQRRGRPVLRPSPIGVTIDGADLGEKASIADGVQAESLDDSYAHLGHTSTIRNVGRRIRVPIQHAKGNWTLEVAAYDDGAAWRYVVPGSGPRKVNGEATSFRVPEGSTYWSHTDTVNYEGLYRRYDATIIGQRTMTMPLTLELPGGEGFACLAEADVMRYSGMSLKARGFNEFRAAFEDDAEGWAADGEIASPWRVCIAVDDLNALVNSTIVYNLSPKPDAALFPDGAKTDWIRPGRSLWQWWHYGWDGLNFDKQKPFIDGAAALGCHYYLIDDGWEDEKRGWITSTKTKWDSLRELADYAGSKNVKLWVWREWKRLEAPAEREDFYKRLAEIGVVGVKIDFMSSESHKMLAFYRDALADAARHKLMVNFHGANKSAGENRTWPNEVSREAVYGLEYNKGGPVITLEHYTAVPFTAMIGGAKDFTPTTFRRGNAGTTAAFQLATAVVYASPFFCWANRPEEFLESPALDLIRTMPTTWDETIVLRDSKIGSFVALARRSGDEWWIAMLNGERVSRDYALDLSFLKTGNWTAHAAHDTAGDAWTLKVSDTELTANQQFTVKLEPAGGYLARVRKAK